MLKSTWDLWTAHHKMSNPYASQTNASEAGLDHLNGETQSKESLGLRRTKRSSEAYELHNWTCDKSCTAQHPGDGPEMTSTQDQEQDDESEESVTEGRRDSISTIGSYALYTPDEEHTIVGKLDRRLVLFVAFLYMLSFLDRSSIYRL